MYSYSDKERVANIINLIFEIAVGNFSYTLERSDRNDHLESFIVSLNMMVQEMRATFNHFAYINPHESYRVAVQMTFELDENLFITSFSPSVNNVLFLDDKDLYLKPFIDLLTEESKKDWEKEKEKIINDPAKNYTLKLNFKTHKSLMVPAFCSIHSLVNSEKRPLNYMITSLLTIVTSRENEKAWQESIKTAGHKSKRKNAEKVIALRRSSDIDKVRDVYDHILKHLQEPLLNLKDLANEFGTNEFKLKIGFKQLFNTTVFRLQKEERLKRGHFMIQSMDLSLKEIAARIGLSNYSHFSKIFKERYGYNPQTLKNNKSNKK